MWLRLLHTRNTSIYVQTTAHLCAMFEQTDVIEKEKNDVILIKMNFVNDDTLEYTVLLTKDQNLNFLVTPSLGLPRPKWCSIETQ